LRFASDISQYMWSVIVNRFVGLLTVNRVSLLVMPSQPLRLQYLFREFFEGGAHNRTSCCRGNDEWQIRWELLLKEETLLYHCNERKLPVFRRRKI